MPAAPGRPEYGSGPRFRRRAFIKGGAAAAGSLIVGSVPLARAGGTGPADTVLRGGPVLTLDSRRPSARAVAISGGRIAYVGDEQGVAAHIGPATEVIDLAGRMVMPGIHDGHIHPLGGGQSLTAPSLNYRQLQLPQFLDAIADLLAETQRDGPDTWLVVGEWDATTMNKVPTKEDLDGLNTPRPILVVALDGHIALVNSRGLELAGITDRTRDPSDGEIRRDRNGEATGILLDGAIGLAFDVIPPPTPEQNRRALEAAHRLMARRGITSYLDAAAGTAELTALAEMSDQGALTVRPSACDVVDAEEAADADAMLAELEQRRATYARRDVGFRTVKMFFDGVIEHPTQTAALLRPYLVNKGTRKNPDWVPGKSNGPTYFPQRIANRGIAALDAAGWQVHVHAIGDRGVRSALDAFEHARRVNGPTDNRHTIVHLELVHPKDFRRFAELDVLPNMQLHWAERDDYTIDRLKPYVGTKRWRHTYPAGSLNQAGARLCGGSDWPVDPLLPFRQIEIAVNRTADEVYKGYPKPLFPGQGLELRTSIVMHTKNSAFQLHQENLTGRISEGLAADLIVLDRDLFDVPLKRVSKTEVELTLVGGRTVHRSRDL